ncbi:MAG TPA: putative toxin-antitoxin system toxin component, PIN family, partial [Salinimicrobium sp.]|nr:putative toxin-antitoxin system toxin component, PIN family [Salinimicrobium sp.]
RPKFKNYFSKKDVEKIFEYFDHFGELIIVESDIKICRDEKDNFLLNLSVDSKANYLITGDKDLLILNNIEKTKIRTLSDFIKEFS